MVHAIERPHNGRMTRLESEWPAPRLQTGPGLKNHLQALCRRWGLMLALQVVGFDAAARLARMGGRFVWKHLPLMNRQVLETIQEALRAGHSPDEIDEIARRYTTDLWLGFIETEYIFRRITARDWQRFIKWRSIEPVVDAVRAGRGVVGAGIYLGNHQVGLTALGRLLRGNVAGIVSPYQYSVQQRWMAGLARRRLMRLYPRGDAVRNSIRALRQGRLLTVIAEHSRESKTAVPVEYLGERRFFHPTAAMLAWRTQCPLVLMTCHRLDRPFQFQLTLHDWIEPPRMRRGRREWIHDTTVRVMKCFDAIVRACPEQYAWARQHQIAGVDAT